MASPGGRGNRGGVKGAWLALLQVRSEPQCVSSYIDPLASVDINIEPGREITQHTSQETDVSSLSSPLRDSIVEDDVEKGRVGPAPDEDGVAGITGMASAHPTLSSRRATFGSYATVLAPAAHARRSLSVLPSQISGARDRARNQEHRQAIDGGVWLLGGPQTPGPPPERPFSMPPLPPLPPPLPRTSHDLSLYRTITASTGADSQKTLPPPYGTFSD